MNALLGLLGVVAVGLAEASAAEGEVQVVTLVMRERGSGAAVDEAWVERDGQRLDAPGGRLSLELPPGTHILLLGSPVHIPLEVPVQVPGPAEVQVFLRAELAPPEIVVEARRPSVHVSRQVLDRERVEQTPGAFDDPIRLIQSLPGVAVTREFGPQVGQVAIRGAAPAESRFFVDGIELPYLYHFDQYASVVPIRVLEEVAVYPSAFGAAYGDVVGAVVAATTRSPDPERAHGAVDVNFIMAGAQASVPLSPTLTFSASARRSYLDLAESSNDQYTVWPVFYDFTSRVDWRPEPDQSMSLVVLGAGDSYGRYAGDTAVLDPLEREDAAVFDSDRDFQAVLVEHHGRSGKLRSDSVLGLVHDDWSGSLADALQDRQELQLSLRNESRLVLGPHELALGGDGRIERVALLCQTDRAWPELGAEAPLLEHGLPLDEDRRRLGGGVYVEPRLQFGPARVQPGLRLEGDSSVSGPAIDPRISTEIELPRELRLRAALGRYSQAPEADMQALYDAEPGADGGGLPWTRAEHAVLGLDVPIAGRLELGAEGWARWLHDAVIDDPDQGIAVVDGSALGLELSSRYRLRERFFSSFSLSLGRARRDDRPFDYDQPYALNLVLSWDFLPGWNAGARWRYAAGTPFTPIVGATYDGDQDRYLPVQGPTNSERLADYQKFDLHLERDWSWRTWELDLYFELWWVPPANNVLYPVYSYDYSERAFVVGPPLVPLLGLRAGF